MNDSINNDGYWDVPSKSIFTSVELNKRRAIAEQDKMVNDVRTKLFSSRFADANETDDMDDETEQGDS